MVVKSRKMLFVLVLVGLLTAGGGCYKTGGTGGESDADADSDSDSDSDTDGDTDTPVEGHGARLKLIQYSTSLSEVTGYIAVDEALKSNLVGQPTVSVASASKPALESFEVTQMTSVSGGFSFHGTWVDTSADTDAPTLGDSVTLRTVLAIACSDVDADVDGEMDVDTSCGEEEQCPGGSDDTDSVYWYEHVANAVDTDAEDAPVTQGQVCAMPPLSAAKLVASDTYHEVCENFCGSPEWMGAGESCWECEEVAEMAPTPILPGAVADELPLPRAMNLRIEHVLSFGRSVVLVAEPGETIGGVTYDWRISGGVLSQCDLGGVVWELPREPGPHFVQVAVRDEGAAALASLRVVHSA